MSTFPPYRPVLNPPGHPHGLGTVGGDHHNGFCGAFCAEGVLADGEEAGGRS